MSIKFDDSGIRIDPVQYCSERSKKMGAIPSQDLWGKEVDKSRIDFSILPG